MVALATTPYQGLTSPVRISTIIDIFSPCRPIAKGEADLTIYFGYCVQVAPCPNADPDLQTGPRAATPHFSAHVTWHESEGRYLIVAYELQRAAINDISREPWLDTAIQLRTGSRVSVGATPDLAGRLPEALAASDAAAAVADRYACLIRPSRYIVYLANPTQWKTWFGGHESTDDPVIAGYPAETTLSSDIVVLNMAAIDKYESPLTDILSHEFGHVVTLLARQGGISYPLLEEGIAEYIEHDGRAVASYDRLDAVRRFVHSGQWNGSLDQVEKYFYGNNARLDITYGMGYLTWRCIADTYGQDRLFAFAKDALRDDGADKGAAEALGKSWADVERACAGYIRSAVR